ncbi:MAG: hypothetical protein ACTS6O_06160 [Giesbergeria sp.]
MTQKTSPVLLHPLPWYEPETYERVCALMHDQNRLFGTYAERLRAAERTEQNLSKDGARPIRVTLDLVRFPAWCAAHRPGQHIDAQARIQYASFVAAQDYQASQGGAAH